MSFGRNARYALITMIEQVCLVWQSAAKRSTAQQLAALRQANAHIERTERAGAVQRPVAACASASRTLEEKFSAL